MTDLTTNLSAWYKINDGSGTNIVDSSVNANTAILTAGSGSWTASAPVGAAYPKAFTFNASSIAVPVGVSINPLTQSFTISVFVYGTSFGTYPEIIGFAGANIYIFLGQNIGTSSAGINAFIKNGGIIETLNLNTFSVNKWTHVAMTWNLTNLILYVNGIQQDTRTGGALTSGVDNTFFIGSGVPGGNSNWAGYIQNVRFYVGRTLSSVEIAALYSVDGFSQNTAGIMVGL